MNGTGVLWGIGHDDAGFSDLFNHTGLGRDVLSAYFDLNCRSGMAIELSYVSKCLAAHYFLRFMQYRKFLNPLWRFREWDNRLDKYRTQFRNTSDPTWSVALCQGATTMEEALQRKTQLLLMQMFDSMGFSSEPSQAKE